MDKRLIFIAGPCVIENKRATLDIAARLKEITAPLPVRFIFKASFDKANRTSLHSFRGPGLSRGLGVLEAVKKKLAIPVSSDVHQPQQVALVRDVLDVIQIPAFLCRQTDLILAAARTMKTVNIKKGQFLSPYDLRHIVSKIQSTGNKNILLTERGSCFGYNNLVVDFRSFLIMKQSGFPVIFDATHSLQRPSAAGGISGGDRKFVPALGLAAVACGVDGIFMEVHPKPREALSDRHTVFPLSGVRQLLGRMLAVRRAISEQ